MEGREGGQKAETGRRTGAARSTTTACGAHTREWGARSPVFWRAACAILVQVRYDRFLSQAGEGGARSRFASACAGHTVLVTGAGGYIGSALVKAIATAPPIRIVLLDSSEHNLFQIRQYLLAMHPPVPHEAILGSVTDRGLLDSLFTSFRPSIMYHAAALKHVPLLELNPLAAVCNNALGTYRLARAALQHGVRTLVSVSTDKAVNPHSIMGASKRIAELVVTTLAGPECRMNAVRLGNVAGSSGSVVPIFREQISRRGPVTVTHPEVSRYFVSTHDAVEAILAAGAAQCTGRILLPDLGEPERIADLARLLIGAAANGSGNEIEIQFIGLRPGEKIAEDLLLRTEIREGFACGPLEVILTPSPAPEELHGRMEQLARHIAGRDVAGLVETVSALVPEYQPSSIIRAAAGAFESVAR
jgi:FlaA1/EpsC-like NDP-sugar epimerase